MRPTGIAKLQRLFREAASLDIDKEDIKRYEEFVTFKIGDLLLRGEATRAQTAATLSSPQPFATELSDEAEERLPNIAARTHECILGAPWLLEDPGGAAENHSIRTRAHSPS